MNFEGRIGTENVSAVVRDDQITIHMKKTSDKKKLMFVGVQRYSKNLKDFDVVWVCSDMYYVHTVPNHYMEPLVSMCSVPFFDIGPDPAPWRRWWNQSKKNHWDLRDWTFMLTPIESDQSDDSDWQPDSEYSSDGASDGASDSDE